jgi:hypothetical protein
MKALELAAYLLMAYHIWRIKYPVRLQRKASETPGL